MIRSLCRLVGMAGFVASGLVAPDPVHGQAEPQGDPGSNPWRLSTELDVETFYDNNIYLLDTGKKDDLASPSNSDLASGRFADMESQGDLVTMLSLGARLKSRGLYDRSLAFVPRIEYDLYARNTKRSNAHFSLTLRQALPKGGQVGLRGRLRPSYFSKNYLADAVDRDGSGTIGRDERVYQPGEYAEADVSVEAHARLAKSRRDRPVGARLELEAGYYRREYDSPFSGRDLEGPTASTRLALETRHDVEVELGYEIAALSGETTSEVLILDEPDFGVDFNGDGSPDDLDARTVQSVDRSHLEHSIAAEVGFDAGPATRVRLSYEVRLRNYSSGEPFDVVYRDRHDTRHAVALRVNRRVGHGLRLVFGGEYASQGTNRGGDPGWSGDTDDYARLRALLGVTYEP